MAAEAGHRTSQLLLAYSYEFGDGVPQDYSQMVRWLQAAAEQGSSEAQHYLGVAYAEGQGVPQDAVLAHMWMSMAATSGLNRASVGLDVLETTMSGEEVARAQAMARDRRGSDRDNTSDINDRSPPRPAPRALPEAAADRR
jgi:TPR repeat protein